MKINWILTDWTDWPTINDGWVRQQDNQHDEADEETEVENASEEFQSLKAYIPDSVLRFLTQE